MELKSQEKYDFYIIDISYTEFNRGSYGYLPYILYCGLKAEGYNVGISEDFTLAQLKDLPPAYEYYIACWAYPQQDLAQVLNKFIEGRFTFFGYYPLLKHLNLPFTVIGKDIIKKGIANYHKYYHDFKFILLCDDDMHLSKYDGTVYPLFTSYGCPNRCAFCPATVNGNYERLVLPTDQVITILEECYDQGIRNIHFTDEDFFFDISRTYDILQSVKNKGMAFIALATVKNALRYVKKYGEESLIEAGVKIIEVGLETADEEIATSMHKPKKPDYIELYEYLKEVNIFWLTLTFFPGETIKSLNRTGEFLKKYGYKIDEVYARIATNSTEGGLGQFMQLYHGVADYKKMCSQGIHLTDRPVRLLPSFVPHSFLGSQIEWQHRDINNEDRKWFKLYRVNPDLYSIEIGRTISELTNTSDGYIFYAICARLGIIS